MLSQPFLRPFVTPAALCALGFIATMAAVLQFSLRAYVPRALEPGGLTLDNFAGLMRPLFARVFFDTVWICFVTAAFTLALLWQIRCVAGWRSGPEGTSSAAARVEEGDDGRAYGRKARLRRRTARLFFPDSLLEGAGAGGRGKRSCS